jgi:uncharacterized protein YktB (UPF0637 family)
MLAREVGYTGPDMERERMEISAEYLQPKDRREGKDMCQAISNHVNNSNQHTHSRSHPARTIQTPQTSPIS